ncbi:tRNA (adenine-N1)-methyltransferase [Candidatus Bathyarchaeota archaeon]|nr:tRNA (adenine-N1)-methyltransferase [Candidatus Bathyarchaeota archaeon]
MSDNEIKEGDDVLLFLDSRRNYLVHARKGERFHTHKGFILFDEILNKSFGQTVQSNLGHSFVILRPTIYDYLMKSLRSTQILYPKDIGLILVYAGVTPGDRVVEAGTGSGALTTALANAVQPTGRVYTYDVRPEFQKRAASNLERAGLLPFVELKIGDVSQEIEERDVDAVVLDLATPWTVISKAREALKGGGNIVTFSPTIEQVVKTVSALDSEGFVDVETTESFLRRIKVKEGETRPETLMVGHTGYLTRARSTKI